MQLELRVHKVTHQSEHKGRQVLEEDKDHHQLEHKDRQVPQVLKVIHR